MSAVETIEPEVVNQAPAPESAMLAVVAQSGLPAETAQTLQAAFLPAFSEARAIIEKSRGIVVTNVSQTLDIKAARLYRLGLRNVRTGADRLRKELKEDGLRRGKAIDGFYNILVHLLDGEETRLEEQEKFAERAEQARRNALEVERTKELAAYGVSLVGLGAMADDTYAQLLFNAKAGHEAKLEAARKAEAERIAAENARLVEEARIRAENEKLKAEALAAEAAARAEKARVEALAAEEKRKAAEAAKKAAAKAKAERDAIEAKAKAEREAAEATARAERERLQAEAEIERKKAEAARVAAEAKAREEREAREKVEAQLKAKADAEAKRVADEAEAQRQAALAPDKEKLLGLAIQLRATGIPALSTSDGRAVTALLVAKLDKLAAWLEQEASVL